MTAREENKAVARRFVTSPFWKPEYRELLADGLVIDFPSAPPGMPQYFSGPETERYLEWMNRTVRTWQVELEELHGVQNDTVTFWAVGRCGGQVFWGLQDGEFQSKFIFRLRVVRRRVVQVKMMMDPLCFLKAAGRICPLFRMDLHHPEIEARLSQHPQNPHSKAEEAPEAAPGRPVDLRQRILGNLDAFRSPDYWASVSHLATYSPHLKAYVWFLPPEMGQADYSQAEMPRVDCWSVLSCPDIDFDSSGTTWMADDASVYFGEYTCNGRTRWLGNGVEGCYRNHYFYILRMDEEGRIAVSEEFLNPINKFNSINVSLPSFPYYL